MNFVPRRSSSLCRTALKYWGERRIKSAVNLTIASSSQPKTPQRRGDFDHPNLAVFLNGPFKSLRDLRRLNRQEAYGRISSDAKPVGIVTKDVRNSNPNQALNPKQIPVPKPLLHQMSGEKENGDCRSLCDFSGSITTKLIKNRYETRAARRRSHSAG